MNTEIREGMPVVDATGEHIGVVESLTAEHFFVTKIGLVETRIVADRDEVEDVVEGEVHLKVDRNALLTAHLRPPEDKSLVEVTPHESGVEQLQRGEEHRRNLEHDDLPEGRH
jgi:hypothetical protein